MTANGGEPKAPNFTGWFIAAGVVTAVVLGWIAMGQPGRPLQDGNYGCSAGALAVGGGPGATVQGGKVVDVWDFSMRTGERTSLRFQDAERTGPKKFSVTSEVPGLKSGQMQGYVCTFG
jgi:hypothetical protein